MYYRYWLLLLALLLAASAPARAQFIWQQQMGTAAAYETSGGFVAVPGGFVHAGRTNGVPGGGINATDLYLSKVTAAGAVLWQKQVSLASRNLGVIETQGVAADATGQLYVSGQCTERTPVHPPGQNGLYYFGLLVKLSATGDTLWSRVLHGFDKSYYGKSVVTPDGGVVVVGANDLDRFVAKFSASGQEEWYHTFFYSSTLPGYTSNILALPTGGYLVRQEPYYGGLPGHYLLLDAQGQLLATKPTRTSTYFFMRLDADGNVLDGAGRLYKVSPTGDTLWSRQYVQYGHPVEARIAIEVPGGRYLVGGQRYNTLDYDVSLLLVDKNNGAVLHDTLLAHYGGNDFVTGLHVDGQGNYLVGGFTDDNGPIGGADQFAFLLRNWDRLLPTRPGQGALAGYGLYPNPVGTGQPVGVSTPAGAAYTGAYELRDALGRLLRGGPTLPTGGLPTQGLPAGLYLLRLQAHDQWLPALQVQVI